MLSRSQNEKREREVEAILFKNNIVVHILRQTVLKDIYSSTYENKKIEIRVIQPCLTKQGEEASALFFLYGLMAQTTEWG